MNPEPPLLAPPSPQLQAQLPRLFLREPGWRVALKVGSDRMFCYMMAPGQDHYHRLLDGEVYVYHGDERICLACASRRGILSFEARGLGGEILADRDLNGPHGSQFDLAALNAQATSRDEGGDSSR